MGEPPATSGVTEALGTSLSFAPRHADDGSARSLVASWLKVIPMEEARCRDVLVVVSELLTNAGQYGVAGSVRVDCRAASGRISVAVRNAETDKRVPPQRDWAMPDPLAASGRGLAIVDRLADAVEVRRERDAVEIAATFNWSAADAHHRSRGRSHDSRDFTASA